MSGHVLVYDHNAALVTRLRGHKLVVRVKDPAELPEAVEAARRENDLHAAWVESGVPLADLDLSPLESLPSTAVYIKVPGLGPFRDWILHVPLLRGCDAMPVVDADGPASYRDIRLLASLGVRAGIRFGAGRPDWEALADLLSYAAYGMVPHGAIQPFQYIMDTYGPEAELDLGDVFLENPERFLHLDADGRLFLTREDLEAARDPLGDLSDLGAVSRTKAYERKINGWREFFLGVDDCAVCPTWRLCRGRFAPFRLEDPGCRDFFGELLEAAEDRLERKGDGPALPFPWFEGSTKTP